MNIYDEQRELTQEKRVRAGLPEVRCPRCGKAGARHWEPDSITRAGHYTCEEDS